MKLWGILVNTIKNKFYCTLCFSLKLWSQIRLLGTVYNFFIKFKGVIKTNLFIPCVVPTIIIIIITNYAWWPWQESVLVWGCSYNTFKKFSHMKKYYRKYILSKFFISIGFSILSIYTLQYCLQSTPSKMCLLWSSYKTIKRAISEK